MPAGHVDFKYPITTVGSSLEGEKDRKAAGGEMESDSSAALEREMQAA